MGSEVLGDDISIRPQFVDYEFLIGCPHKFPVMEFILIFTYYRCSNELRLSATMNAMLANVSAYCTVA